MQLNNTKIVFMLELVILDWGAKPGAVIAALRRCENFSMDEIW